MPRSKTAKPKFASLKKHFSTYRIFKVKASDYIGDTELKRDKIRTMHRLIHKRDNKKDPIDLFIIESKTGLEFDAWITGNKVIKSDSQLDKLLNRFEVYNGFTKKTKTKKRKVVKAKRKTTKRKSAKRAIKAVKKTAKRAKKAHTVGR